MMKSERRRLCIGWAITIIVIGLCAWAIFYGRSSLSGCALPERPSMIVPPDSVG